MIEKLQEGYLTELQVDDQWNLRKFIPFRKTKKHWFVLYRRDYCPFIRYYNRPPRSPNDRPLFDYPLTDNTKIHQLEEPNANRFHLFLDEETQLILQATSREEAVMWISIIRSQFQSKPQSQSSPSPEGSTFTWTHEETNSTVPRISSPYSLVNTEDGETEDVAGGVSGIPPNPDPPVFDKFSSPIAVRGFCEPPLKHKHQRRTLDLTQNSLSYGTASRLVVSPITRGSTNDDSYLGSLRMQPVNQLYFEDWVGSSKCSVSDQRFGPVFRAIYSLQEQIANPGGITVRGWVTDFHEALATVDWDNRVWIAGWKTTCVRLHGLFHIGDQVMELGGIPIHSTKTFYNTLKALQIEGNGLSVCASLRLRRLPLGKVFAVRRTRPGQNIGLRLVAGTNQVSHVDPGGLAARIGLSSHPGTFRSVASNKSESRGSWTITEINGQTLDLFGRKNEASVLLNAYGAEVTVVVQPTDFIVQIADKLKKFRSHKQYVPR